MAAESLHEMLETAARQLGTDVVPGSEDYAVAATVILFVIEEAWPAFTAWSESHTGRSIPLPEVAVALVRLNASFHALDQ